MENCDPEYRLTLGYVQVTYFKQRRVMEHNKKTTLEQLSKEGAERIGDDLPLNMPRGQSRS